MRRVPFLAAGLVVLWAITAGANQPPRVIELTDGTIPLSSPVWCPDGKRVAAVGADGVYVIEAKEGTQPKRLTELHLYQLIWVSDTELIGVLSEKRSWPPDHRVKTYRVDMTGQVRLIWHGEPRGLPFRTTAGRVWYDSAGTWVTNRELTPLRAAGESPEFRLVNHYPQHWRSGKPLHEDTDLWLESPDGIQRTQLMEGEEFLTAQIAGDRKHIVGKSRKGSLIILTLDGSALASVRKDEDTPQQDRFATIGDPDLSPDTQLLIFKRGWESEKAQEPLGADIFVYEIANGQETRITNDPGAHYRSPRFSPLDNRAVFVGKGRLFLVDFRSR